MFRIYFIQLWLYKALNHCYTSRLSRWMQIVSYSLLCIFTECLMISKLNRVSFFGLLIKFSFLWDSPDCCTRQSIFPLHKLKLEGDLWSCRSIKSISSSVRCWPFFLFSKSSCIWSSGQKLLQLSGTPIWRNFDTSFGSYPKYGSLLVDFPSSNTSCSLIFNWSLIRSFSIFKSIIFSSSFIFVFTISSMSFSVWSLILSLIGFQFVDSEIGLWSSSELSLSLSSNLLIRDPSLFVRRAVNCCQLQMWMSQFWTSAVTYSKCSSSTLAEGWKVYTFTFCLLFLCLSICTITFEASCRLRKKQGLLQNCK